MMPVEVDVSFQKRLLEPAEPGTWIGLLFSSSAPRPLTISLLNSTIQGNLDIVTEDFAIHDLNGPAPCLDGVALEVTYYDGFISPFVRWLASELEVAGWSGMIGLSKAFIDLGLVRYSEPRWAMLLRLESGGVGRSAVVAVSRWIVDECDEVFFYGVGNELCSGEDLEEMVSAALECSRRFRVRGYRDGHLFANYVYYGGEGALLVGEAVAGVHSHKALARLLLNIEDGLQYGAVLALDQEIYERLSRAIAVERHFERFFLVAGKAWIPAPALLQTVDDGILSRLSGTTGLTIEGRRRGRATVRSVEVGHIDGEVDVFVDRTSAFRSICLAPSFRVLLDTVLNEPVRGDTDSDVYWPDR